MARFLSRRSRISSTARRSLLDGCMPCFHDHEIETVFNGSQPPASCTPKPSRHAARKVPLCRSDHSSFRWQRSRLVDRSIVYRSPPWHFHNGSPSSRRLRLSETPEKWTWTFCARCSKKDLDQNPFAGKAWCAIGQTGAPSKPWKQAGSSTAVLTVAARPTPLVSFTKLTALYAVLWLERKIAEEVSTRAWLTAARRAVPGDAPTPTPRLVLTATRHFWEPPAVSLPSGAVWRDAAAPPRPPKRAVWRGTRPSRARGRQVGGATRPTRPLLLPRACR